MEIHDPTEDWTRNHELGSMNCRGITSTYSRIPHTRYKILTRLIYYSYSYYVWAWVRIVWVSDRWYGSGRVLTGGARGVGESSLSSESQAASQKLKRQVAAHLSIFSISTHQGTLNLWKLKLQLANWELLLRARRGSWDADAAPPEVNRNKAKVRRLSKTPASSSRPSPSHPPGGSLKQIQNPILISNSNSIPPNCNFQFQFPIPISNFQFQIPTRTSNSRAIMSCIPLPSSPHVHVSILNICIL
jgi:hypothetical protein